MAEFREDLRCPICLGFYTEPVSLSCCHNFCHSCIKSVLDNNEELRPYSCPVCRAEYPQRPVLHKTAKLRKIVKCFQSSQLGEREIFCTYCFQVAVKACVHCETSMCEEHLTIHNNNMDHLLTSPTVTFQAKKCPVHKEFLRYFCRQDLALACLSCCVAGPHKNHDVMTLDEAFAKKKEKLKNEFEKIRLKGKKIDKQMSDQKQKEKNVKGQAEGERQRFTALFEELRKSVDHLEKDIQSMISGQEEKVLQTVTDCIQVLKAQKNKLANKKSHIEELFTRNDPITVLLDPELDDGDGELEVDQKAFLGTVDLDEVDPVQLSLAFHKSLTDLIKSIKLKGPFNIIEGSALQLNVNTASNDLTLSDDLKTAYLAKKEHKRPDLPERFKFYSQVMSIQSFSSGRHYWEVDILKNRSTDVGMCYPSIPKDGDESVMGNYESWALHLEAKIFSAQHSNSLDDIFPEEPVQKLGVYLDYEGGRLSFYQLCDPIKHLYTFTDRFVEPLHAVFDLSFCGGITIR